MGKWGEGTDETEKEGEEGREEINKGKRIEVDLLKFVSYD